MITPLKRAKMEKLIYSVFKALDPTGTNSKKYKAMFESLSDTQFDKFFRTLFSNEDEYLVLDVIDYERDLTLENIEKAADILNIPLFEKLVMPHVSMDINRPIVTKEPVPVGYVHTKRVQQMLSKKNGLSTNIDSRSAITGQVTGEDKNGRESDLENSMLIALGADKILRELNGPRADDMHMKSQMHLEIANKGFVALGELEDDPENKTTLNTADVYMIGMTLKSDLVTNGLMLKSVMREEL